MTTAIMEAPTSPSSTSPAALRAVVPIPQVRRSHRHLWILLAITIIGGLLRFSYPTKPPLWGDDAYTVYRTHADYQSMLDILQHDGFTPLHYELYWLLGRAAGTKDSPITRPINGEAPNIVHSVGMTPTVVRLLPALFGTVMVPAMYFLAVQLVRRRTALVVALVTACSAYLLGYSRDMKMYMMVWCFSALSAGCLLWWFRTGTRLAWLAWVAASLAMASSHMTGMALLPFEAIFFLTRSNVKWKQSILFIIGLAITIIPPAGYMTQFNAWVQESVEDFGFEVEGLGWIGPYNAGRTGPELVRYTASAYLLSWEWPKPASVSERPGADPSTDRRIAQWILISLKTATALFILLAVAGAMPWSRRLRGIKEDDPAPPQPWWRVVLWLGLWLILPVYAIYCRSVTDFAAPKEWWTASAQFLAGRTWIDPKTGDVSNWFWFFITLAAAAVAALIFLLPRFRRAMVWLFPLIAGAALGVCIMRMGIPLQSEKSAHASFEWVGAIARPIGQWTDWMSDPITILALAIVLPGLALFYCAPTWSKRSGRIIQFLLVAAVLIGSSWGVYKFVDNKFNKEVAQILDPSATGQTAGDVLQHATPAQIERAKERVATRAWASIFMPRYIGFVWIAFCIALCTLLMRLPTRGLRITAITLLVAVNLSQFSARLFGGTEPPFDKIAPDLWSQDSHNENPDRSIRVYVNDSSQVGSTGHPGWGTLLGQEGKYYLGLARGYWIHPTEWKSSIGNTYFDIGSARGAVRGRQTLLDYASIAQEARFSPSIKHIIVWEKYFDETAERRDRLSPLLGPGWKLISEQDYSVRFHWNWTDLYVYRRSEYVKN